MNKAALSDAPEPSEVPQRPRKTLALITAAPSLVLVIVSVLLTIVVSAVTVWIQREHLAHNPVRYDSVYYQFYNARLHVRLTDESRLVVALSELRENWRHPLRTIPLVLIAPGLLASPYGHMATAVPALLTFLLLLGHYLYRRVGSVRYALGAMVLWCGTAGLYHAAIGLGAYWLEPPAALLLASAMLCLLSSDEGRDLRWLAAFGVFASLAALSRYVAAVYVFVVAGPLLGFYLARRAVRERGLIRPVLWPALVVGGVVAALAGPFIVAQYGPNVGYYGSRGYSLFNHPLSSASFIAESVILLTGPAQALMLLAFGVAYCAVERQTLTRRRIELAVTLWVIIAVPLYSLVVLRVVGATHSLWYAVPLVLVGLVAPFTPAGNGTGRTARNLLAAAMLLAGCIFGGWYAGRAVLLARSPSPEIVTEKAFVLNLGRRLVAGGDKLVWSPFFDEQGHLPLMEAFYDGKGLLMPAGASYFSIHTAYWQTDFPGAAPDEVARRVYAATDRYVDLAVVFQNPDDALTAPWLNNDYSRTVASFVARQIAADPGWSYMETLEDTPYGDLAIYRNIEGTGAYELFLREDGSTRP